MAARTPIKPTTTTVQQDAEVHPTLVLRQKVDQAAEEVTSGLEQEAENIPEHIRKADPKAREKVFETLFNKLHSKINDGIEHLRNQVLEKEPQPPERKRNETDEAFQKREEQYQRDFQAYKDFVDQALPILPTVEEIFSALLEHVGIYFQEVWKLIKQKREKQVPEKMKDELFKKMRDDMTAKVNSLFGSMPNFSHADVTREPNHVTGVNADDAPLE
ncbi:hypothetical protein BaRGS_00027812 [Batillaria attramentaria]|uniref:Uncharacterized protein n=1 Tax=Batillaria attramentaria TaxID=370345 RepID=A0ABD0K0W9_9CAEN